MDTLSVDVMTKAYEHMLNVHRSAFLHRLAQLRPEYAPSNTAEADNLVEIGHKLAGVSKDAAAHLGRMAVRSSQGTVNRSEESTPGSALDPAIYEAIIALKRKSLMSNSAVAE